MRALHLLPLGAIATLAAGCVDSAYTPAENVERAASEPANFSTAIPSHDQLYGQWMLPNGNPWAPYAKMTLLTALASEPGQGDIPNVSELDSVTRALRAGSMTAAAGIPADAMWMVDLRGADSVAFASALSRDRAISAVPTFNNWPSEDELVPAEETLAAMILMPPTRPDVHVAASAPPVFLLDAWRLSHKTDEIADGTTDNRYMLGAGDFPTAAVLKARGLSRVIYVVESLDDVKREEDDLNDLFVAYRAAGIEIQMVDVQTLMGVEVAPPERVWYGTPWMHAHVLIVEPRVTVVHDPWFYRRAHGGFGGVHGAPAWGGHGGFGFGGHGGG
jgi:hypothetical protein